MMQQDKPGDWVVATGVTHSVRDMVEYVFGKLDVSMDKVITNDKFKRPQELDYLRGDATPIRKLGWKPEYTFESMLLEMIEHWLNFMG